MNDKLFLAWNLHQTPMQGINQQSAGIWDWWCDRSVASKQYLLRTKVANNRQHTTTVSPRLETGHKKEQKRLSPDELKQRSYI